MATSDSNDRTSRTPRKRTTKPAASETTLTRKRAPKKSAAEAPHSTSVTEAARSGAAALSSMTAGRPDAAPTGATPSSATAPSTAPAPIVRTPSQAPVTAVPAPVTARPVAVAGVRPDPVLAKVIDADERRRMIQEAAYHKFLQRGPGNGTPVQDWIEAEAEIDALLAEQHIVRTQ